MWGRTGWLGSQQGTGGGSQEGEGEGKAKVMLQSTLCWWPKTPGSPAHKPPVRA